ncbi:MAG: transporter [Sphingobacteriaceae bacterium]|nr:transporter [Sphingobacteriaceae bacterium]
MANSLHVNDAKAGSISMLTQIGYGLGLFFLVPLGDKVNAKKLIFILLCLLTLSALAMSFATTIELVWALSICIGMFAVSAQVLLPMAAGFDPLNRGKNVGFVFSGLLVGILAARVFSGFVADWLGWRYVYRISSLLVFITALMLRSYLPEVKKRFEGHYLQLLQSTLYQARRFKVLREAALTGALVFGTFCSFWTILTFHLSGPPFNYSSNTIGLYGLLAIAGALLAPYIGKFTDRGDKVKALVFSIIITIVSIVLMKFMPHSAFSFIAGVLLLDVGIQIMQITNLARIYALDDQSHSRINTMYMTVYFIGAAVGTSAGLICWRLGGWSLVTWQMLTWCAIALSITLTGSKDKPVNSPAAAG